MPTARLRLTPWYEVFAVTPDDAKFDKWWPSRKQTSACFEAEEVCLTATPGQRQAPVSLGQAALLESKARSEAVAIQPRPV